jgi:hypothetical protein
LGYNAEKINSLKKLFPTLSKEWDSNKNQGLEPENVTPGSGKIVWWICPKGHNFQARIAHRTRANSGCNICANRVVLEGFNDLETTNPELAKEFDLVKNAPLKPNQVLAGAKVKYWWRCPNNHSYAAAGYSRRIGTSCPYCSNKFTLAGTNDLATTNPELAREFDKDKNFPLRLESLQAGSNSLVWWKCELGHTYKASPIKRSLRNDGCPYCSGRRVLSGFNDMATIAPQIAKQFHPTRNGDKTPTQLAAKGSQKLWWMCEQGHEFQATSKNRLQPGGLGCPVCSNHQVLPGYNDLMTTRPDIAETWDYKRNGDVLPSMVIGGSNKKYWWTCDKGHHWFAYLSLRTRGRNCPSCSKGGYDATKPGWVYLIESKEMAAFKVGISNSEFRRLAQYDAHWAVLKVWHHESGRVVADVETAVLKWIRKELNLPPYLSKADMGMAGGASETFSSSEISEIEVSQFIENLFEEHGSMS